MRDVMTFLMPQKGTSQPLAGVNSANPSNLMKSKSLIDHAFQSGVNYTKIILLEDQLEMLRRTHRETQLKAEFNIFKSGSYLTLFADILLRIICH